MTYKRYIILHKNCWAGNALASDCVQAAYKSIIYKYRIIKTVDMRFLCLHLIFNHEHCLAATRRQALPHN
jgi:hypothetical protein